MMAIALNNKKTTRREAWRAFALSAVLSIVLVAPSAYAQGCAPAPSGAVGLPPCCATTDMSAGGTCMAPATRYQFTIFSFGFEKSDGTVVEFGHAQSFDAASVGAGSDIGNYISGATLTPGAYVAARPVISRAINVATQVTTRDGRICSGSTTAPSQQPDGQTWPNCAAGQPDAVTTQCLTGGQLRIRDGQAGNLTITGNGGVTISLKFDVNNGALCTFTPGAGAATAVGLGMLSVRMTKS